MVNKVDVVTVICDVNVVNKVSLVGVVCVDGLVSVDGVVTVVCVCRQCRQFSHYIQCSHCS